MVLKDKDKARVKYCLLAGGDWVLTEGDAKVMEEIVDRARVREVDEDGMLVCDGVRRFFPEDFETDEGEETERRPPQPTRRRRAPKGE